MKKFIALIFIFSFFQTEFLFPQMQLDWVKIYNGTFSGGVDGAKAITLDKNSNSYVTGFSQISGNIFECVTIKYNLLSNIVWENHYQRSMNSTGFDIQIDDSGYIFVACGSILKYKESGELMWSKFDSVGYYKLILDSIGITYGGGISLEEHLTVGKYNNNGERIWRKKYSFPGSAGVDRFGGFTMDRSGNIIVTGRSKSNTTFYDFATIKYSNNGDLIWSRRYNGPSSYSFDDAEGVTADIFGNVYVTGTSMDSLNNYNFVTIKYDSLGNEIWLKRIPANQFIADIGYNIKTDSSQNVFIAGRLSGKTSIIKLDRNGNVLWYRVYPEGRSATDNYPVIVLDSIYNVYTTAISTATGAADYAAIKYDSSGNQIYSVIYNNSNTGFEYAYDLALGKNGDLYLTGEFSANGRCYGTVKYSPIITGIEINNNNPFEFKLEQNYPNPFNPVTHFGFGISNLGFVSLKVYDVLGKEVAALVNEQKSPGSYEVEFDGSDLSSGIYFYSLQIEGKIVQTKSMVLLK